MGWNEGEESIESTEGTDEAYNPGESARETVEKAFKELSGEVDGDQGEAQAQKTKEEGLEDNEPIVTKGRNREVDLDLLPPERLKAQEKEMFKNLPKSLKKAFNRSVSELEGSMTRANQEASRRIQLAESQSSGIIEAIRPYLTEWGEQGFTAQSAIAALAASHAKLTNPKTSKQAYEELGRNLGIVTGAPSQNGEQNHEVDISNHPVVKELKSQLQGLQQKYEPVLLNHQRQVDAQHQNIASSIVEEISAIREETDASGRYLYPELHDDEILLNTVKPLVSAIVGNVRGISYGEATRRAIATLRGEAPRNSYNPNQTRLPTNNNNQRIEDRASRAALLARGRLGGGASSNGLGEPPPEALGSARDTVQWALDMHRRGGV